MSARLVAPRTAMPLRAWLATKSPTERRVIATIAILVAIVLLWLLAWDPLQRDVQRLRLENGREQAALALAHHEVDEITALQRAAASPPADVRTAVQQSLVTAGLRSAVTDLQWPQSRAQVTFAGVEFTALARWLERLHRDNGIVVREATLSARVEPGAVRAELVLGR